MATYSDLRFDRVRTAGYLGLVLLWGGQLPVQAAPSLVIDVLRGSGGNNNALTGASVSLVIRVRDETGNPVADALVVFAAPSAGASVNFAGEGPVAQVVSDESGTAIAPHPVPTGEDGSVEIRVLATKNGDSANRSIFQMNLGIHRESALGDGLDLSRFAEIGTAERKGGGLRRFQVFVSEGSDKPVAGVSVEFMVRGEKNHAKWEELEPLQGVSGPDGWVSAALHRKPGRIPLEFSVKAVLNGQIATRYFIVER
jgi:hypothetical protein